jgi:tRNA(Arg) A34 adenosine deaminase TadA
MGRGQMLNETELTHLRRAISLARSAREHGNHPFGALLISAEGEVLAEAENTVNTESDCTGHAETNLVRLASKRFDLPTLAGSTLYTSTEPCAMCSGAIYWSGVGRVVFALAEDQLYQLTGTDPTNETMRLPCREVFARCRRPIEVIGPLLEEEAIVVHYGFWVP